MVEEVQASLKQRFIDWCNAPYRRIYGLIVFLIVMASSSAGVWASTQASINRTHDTRAIIAHMNEQISQLLLGQCIETAAGRESIRTFMDTLIDRYTVGDDNAQLHVILDDNINHRDCSSLTVPTTTWLP